MYSSVSSHNSVYIIYRALELAVKYKTHVDTVLAYREHYLSSIGSKESLQNFVQLSGKVGDLQCLSSV